MDDNVVRLDYHGREILIIPTAHVLEQSAALVRKVITEERPDTVCIELDAARYQNLKDPKGWENTDLVQVIKARKVGFLLASLVLGSFQKRIAGSLNAVAGQEMLAAAESAAEVGATVVMADRDIRTTFLRIWRGMSLWEKCKLFFTLIYSFAEDEELKPEDVSDLLKQDSLEPLLADMRKHLPRVGEVLIAERDQYLAHRIKQAPGNKVVAVMGGAHVPGVTQELFKTQDVEKITTVPPASRIPTIIGWAIPAVIVGLIVYGFVMSVQTGLEQLQAWVLWNGVLAALFTAAALGHPLSILTAFVSAPLTSLNPLVACGWVTGLVEATVRRPTVRDVNSISSDIFSVRGWLRNRFLRVLLIVIAANLGSSLGTFIAGTDMVSNLFGH